MKFCSKKKLAKRSEKKATKKTLEEAKECTPPLTRKQALELNEHIVPSIKQPAREKTLDVWNNLGES